MSRRQFAKALGISTAHVRALERWTRPPHRHLVLMERQLRLHDEVAAGWLAALRRAEEKHEDPRQLHLFEPLADEGTFGDG